MELERQLNEMKTDIMKSSVEVDHNLSNDLTTILSETQENITPFMNLFWQRQKKLLQSSPSGVKIFIIIFILLFSAY